MSMPEKLGRYEILSELGKGAMGVVYLGRDPLIGRELALKTFRLGYSAGDQELEQFRTRFLREAQSAGILSHPNIVTIHDVAVDPGGDFFIAMEYVQGTDLKLVMQRQRLEPRFATEVVAQIADGLGYAHSKGVVHRDVKPANVIITTDKQAKITDFGIARVEASNLTMEGQLLGTPNYMAPEQIQGQAVDHRADIFSLGVMYYELLTGKKPFAAENLTAVTHKIVYEPFPPLEEQAPGLPAACTDVLGRALAKDPTVRYSQGADMASDLRAIYTPQTGELPAVRRGGSFLDDARQASTAATATVPLAAPTGSASTAGTPAAGTPTAGTPAPGAPVAGAPAAAAQATGAPVATPAGLPVAGRVAVALGLIVALAVVGFGVFKLVSTDAEPLAAVDPEAERRQQVLTLVEEGRQLLDAGEAEAALAAFERALTIAPEDREVRRLRTRAVSHTLLPAGVDAGDATQLLEAARSALRAHDYDQAVRLAERALEVDPESENGKEVLEEARDSQRRRQEIRTELRNPSSSAGSRPAAPAPPAPAPAAAPAAEATLVIDVRSAVPEGRLTIFNGQQRLLQQTLKRSSLRDSVSVAAGSVDLRIYVTRRNAQTRTAEVKGDLPSGGRKTLAIELSSEGRVKAALE